MTRKERNSLREIYSFMERLYPANSQLRWRKTPYMEHFASQEDLNNIGKIETVPGHVWACDVLRLRVKEICPSLSQEVNFEEVGMRLTYHDIGETERGDISLASRINTKNGMDKDGERKDFVRLVEGLQDEALLIRWFDEFENEPDENTPLEALVARLIDHLQGDHFALTFGENLPKHSETIEKIMKTRSILRSRQLIDALLFRSGNVDDNLRKAAVEVDSITQEHIEMVREAGIKVDFSDLGF